MMVLPHTDLTREDSEDSYACNQCLHNAVKGDNIRKARACFQTHSIDVNSIIDGKTALFHALENANLDMVKLLLSHGADINKLSAVPEQEVDEGSDVQLFTMPMQRETAVLTATRLQNKDCLMALLERGTFDSQVEDLLQKKAMSVAIKNNDVEITELLIKHGFDMENISSQCETALHKAADLGHIEIVDLLLKNGARLTRDDAGITPLHLAAMRGHFECLEVMLGYCHGHFLPCMEDFTGMSPMAYACTNGYIGVIGTLMAYAHEAHGKCIFKSSKPLYLAAFHGHQNIAQYFINNRVHINALHKGESALSGAVRGGHLSIVELFAENGAELDTVGPNGLTPFQTALLCKHYGAMTLLVQHGADVTRPLNKDGNLSIRNKSVVKFMLNCGFRKSPPGLGTIRLSSLDGYVTRALHTPMMLHDICRFSLRHHLKKISTGQSIVNIVRKLQLPSLLKDVLLMKDVKLFATDGNET